MKTDYNIQLEDPRWQDKRQAILNRDSHRCLNCGSKNMLQVHHRQYHFLKLTEAFLQPWKYDNSYLITLCDKCHQAGHDKFKVPVFNIK